VQRKAAGATQELDSLARIAGMGLVGFGRLISAICGLIFATLTIKVLLNKSTDPGKNTNA